MTDSETAGARARARARARALREAREVCIGNRAKKAHAALTEETEL